MENPRHPYFFTVKEARTDEHGDAVTDAEGHPVETDMEVELVETGSGGNPVRDDDGNLATYTVTRVPCGYRTSTGGYRISGEVIVCDYKISTPMMRTELPPETVIEVTDNTRTYRAKIIKATTYNWGSNMWIDEIRN